MQLITQNDQLEPGKEYWAKQKYSGTVTVERCCAEGGHKYVGAGRYWAMDTNNQALERWHLIGPIPERVAPDFAAFGADLNAPLPLTE